MFLTLATLTVLFVEFWMYVVSQAHHLLRFVLVRTLPRKFGFESTEKAHFSNGFALGKWKVIYFFYF